LGGATYIVQGVTRVTARVPEDRSIAGTETKRERLDVKKMIRVRAGLLACVLALALAPAAAQADEEGLTNEAGVGALAALSTLIYGPVKIVYATLGTLFGGIAWGLSGGDRDVMEAVITPAVRGDYVVTPAHIRMEETLEFMGRNPEYRTTQHAAVASENL
jgi:hypothetical protein